MKYGSIFVLWLILKWRFVLNVVFRRFNILGLYGNGDDEMTAVDVSMDTIERGFVKNNIYYYNEDRPKYVSTVEQIRCF